LFFFISDTVHEIMLSKLITLK